MYSRVALTGGLLVAFVLLSACAGPPELRLEDVAQIRFTALESGETRAATEVETRQFIEYYSGSQRIDDDGGTTAPARLDVSLKSGEELVVWGGGEHFQTVGWMNRQFNIRSAGLHRILERFAFDGADTDGKPGLLFEQVESAIFAPIPPGTGREASDDEIRRVTDAYRDARVLDERYETTPPARIELVLKTGHRVVITGGGLPYPMVQSGTREFNVDSPELVGILDSIANEYGNR